LKKFSIDWLLGMKNVGFPVRFASYSFNVAMREIVTGNFAPTKWALWPPRSLRIVDWNVNRGQQLQGIIEFLANTNADILILQEADFNARRTHRLNIAEEIARKLQMNYVFGREFQELVQGSEASPAYHGQATLSRWPISNPRLIRFSRQSHFWQPRWFLPRIEPFQERLGGRIALVAEIDVNGAKLLTYNLHLESRGSDELRLSQVEEVLSDAARQDPESPVIVAGDFNLDAAKDVVASAFARAGFQDALESSRTLTTPSRGLFEPGRRIDWAFVRGPIRAGLGQVHNQVRASDHYPISFMLTR
jgi:endonuclease/exonuclease/phosphatase family metal-dependent hydrolase